MTIVRDIVQYRRLISKLVVFQLKLRYQASFVGLLWVLISPLANMLAITVVFSSIFNMPLLEFGVFIICGFVPWSFFASTVGYSTQCYPNYAGIIKSLSLPKIVFPAQILVSGLVDSLYMLLAILFLLVVLGVNLSSSLIYLPFIYFTLSLFTFGIVLIIAPLSLFYRDFVHIVPILLQIGFFLSPVMFKVSMLSKEIAWVIQLNPMTIFIECFRKIVIDGTDITASDSQALLGISMLSLLLGVIVHLKYTDAISYEF